MNKKLLNTLLLLLFISFTISNGAIHVAMYGNPGAGKSTLLSCLTNTAGNFKSGLNSISGLTKEHSLRKCDDIVYIDTPGLADVHDRKKAAKEIEESLKKNENYKLIFVIEPTAGRIAPADLTTMNMIIESLPEDIQFGIIYNKLSKRVYKDFTNDPNLLGKFHKTHLTREPHSYLLLERLVELEDQDNAIATNEKFITDLRNFITQLPSTHIPMDEVEQIPANEFEDQLQKIEENYKRVQEEYQKEIDRLQDQYSNSCVRYETESEERSTPFDREAGSNSKIDWAKFKKVKETVIEKGETFDKYIRTKCIKGNGDIQYGEWIFVGTRDLVTNKETRKNKRSILKF